MLSGSYCGDAPQPKRTGPARLVPVKDDQGRTGSSIFVYYQQPDGSFADRVDIGFSHNHSLAFAVDWDGDGDLDLITAAAGGRKKAEEYGYGQINLMENTGDVGNPVMAYPVNLLKDLKDQPGSIRSAVACDWDNDGDLDLLGVSTLDIVFIERKDSPGPAAFEEPVALLNLYEKELYKENYSHREFCGMCVTDINGDGVLDILVGETLLSNLADETAFENATEEKKRRTGRPESVSPRSTESS